MNEVLAILQLLSNLIIIFYELKKKSTSIFLWATLLLLFSIPHFFGVITGITSYSDDVMIKASIFALLFNAFFFVLRVVLTNTIRMGRVYEIDFQKFTSLNRYSNRHKRYIILLFVIVNIIFWGLTLFYLGGINDLNWGAYYQLSNNRSIGILFLLMKYLFFTSTSILLVLKYGKNKKIFWIYIFASSLIVVLFGSREFVLPILIVFIVPFLFGNRRSFSVKSIVTFPILGLISIYLVYSIRIITRTVGGIMVFFSNYNIWDLNRLIIEQVINSDGEFGLRNAFYHFILNNNNFPGFNEGHTYLRLLLLLIPTSFSMGIKPTDFTITMGQAWTGDFSSAIYSMHPTFYGDLYANFAWYGIFFGILWAILITAFDYYAIKKSDYEKSILIMLSSSMYVMIGRGSVYNPIYMLVISLILLSVVKIISRVKVA